MSAPAAAEIVEVLQATERAMAAIADLPADDECAGFVVLVNADGTTSVEPLPKTEGSHP